ncbi:uncharacterized protein LOC124889651 [Capsicum annuum]|uniref:uncharacterized protein LOC124889651 n=1 Tax=Capsicum annuum TaxID=4072 RepID=UPI001FB10A73|nr:uncharacterized protein LOC124889651 [Capsicum annuum]
MPLDIFKKLGMSPPKPTTMQLLMENYTVKKTMGKSFDVLVIVNNFIVLDDFVILDYEVDFEMPIILGRPFIAMGRTVVAMEKGELKFILNDEEFNEGEDSDNEDVEFKPPEKVTTQDLQSEEESQDNSTTTALESSSSVSKFE